MQILSGLFDRMVLQRTRQNVSDTVVTGTCAVAGEIQVRVTMRGRTVRGFSWVKIGQATGKRFTARLKHVPVGGPYDIELRIVDRDNETSATASVKDVLVGDVWILAGQSNMEGSGVLERQPKADKLLRVFHMTDKWDIARHPLHRIDLAVDPVHAYLVGDVPRQAPGPACVGPGLAFARMMKQRTAVPQGIIPSAHGGTTMEQWDPSLKKYPGRSLYGATIKRAKLNGGRVAGVLWYQGCSDTSVAQAEVYTARMKALIRAFRRDLRDQRLPIVVVQIARVAVGEIPFHPPWDDIQEQQRLLAREFDRLVVVPTIDLDLEDSVHVSGPSQQRLGRRLAQAMLSLTQRPRHEKSPIQLGGIKIKREAVTDYAIIEVSFKNVAGGFVSVGRPSGFFLSFDGQFPLPAIYKMQFQPNRIVLHTTISHTTISDYKLSYGLGLDPYCNITDQADRSLPVFGPISVGAPRAITPHIRQWRISKVLPGAGKLGRLSRPDTDDKALGWRHRAFLIPFADCHAEWEHLAGQDNHIVYACRFDCAEKMPLALWLGYDGPIKVWVDRKMVFHDPDGTNPAEADAARIDCRAGKGVHDVVVALGSNGGSAWGVFLRIERPDVSPALLRKGPDSYAMPQIIG